MEAQPKGSADTIGMLRLWILGVLVLGLLGTVVELVLLSHYEQAVQLVPVVLIVLALIVLAWHVMGHSVASLRVLMGLMVLFVLAGFAGIAAHFHGSAEFQLDLERRCLDLGAVGKGDACKGATAVGAWR
jgi:hypothetical protein